MGYFNQRRDVDCPSPASPLGSLDSPPPPPLHHRHRHDSIDTPSHKQFFFSQAPPPVSEICSSAFSPSSPRQVKIKRRSLGVQTEVPSREYISPQSRASQAPEHFKQGWLHRYHHHLLSLFFFSSLLFFCFFFFSLLFFLLPFALLFS